ncbi:flagellar hook-associated protein 2 [Paraburkholderia sp. EB58]|jgi:flagellar hook-associated protein 2|uniref:flagellar filament capping protein FliD n=1 Tax=Paraburkholderia sp. EB58 TaxID=3035125 RepID=UPI003D245C20
MSSVTGTSSTPPESAAQAAAAAAAAAQSALQEAGQSLISGVTGDTTLDTSTIVSALVTSKVAAQSAALQDESATDTAEISSYGQLQAALSQLQVGLAPLFNGQLQATFTATASGNGLSATAGAGVTAGTYSVDVTQIAQAQSLTSGAFSSSEANSLGTGTMTISVGGKSMSLNVTSSNNSLTGIAAAINSSSSNPGLTAQVVNGSDGAHLVLQATGTGQTNTINVVVNATTDTGLSALGVTSTAGAGTTAGAIGASTITSTGTNSSYPNTWTQGAAAQNAQFTLNGTPVSSATNSDSTALTGVTLNIASAAVGTTQTLTVASDPTTIESDITNFVSDYNAVVSLMAAQTSFTAGATSSSSSGPLLGDSALTAVQNMLGNLVSSGVPGPNGTVSLASIGITLVSDGSSDSGTLSVNTATLDNAVQNNPTQVAALFNMTNGLGQQLNAAVNTFSESGGVLDQRTAQYTADLQSVKTQATALTAYEAQLTSQYTNEFTALNSLMASTNSDSKYLTALFGGTNSAGALATGASSS